MNVMEKLFNSPWLKAKFLVPALVILMALIIVMVRLFKPALLPNVKAELQVYATPSQSTLETVFLRASGTSKASRKLNILSETSGQIYRLHHQKGQVLNPKDVVATIQLDDRSHQLKEAEAAYNLAKEKYRITETLAEGNFSSNINLKTAKVNLESAAARLARVKKEIKNTTISAPFKGVLGDVMLEEGSVVAPGTIVATLLNLDPVLVQVYVSEKNYNKFHINEVINVKFANDVKTKGKINFISSIADPKTHMFLVEISIENPDFKVPEGVTARVDIPIGKKKIHKITPSMLTLDAEGDMSVKVINASNVVEQYDVVLVKAEKDELWVEGLPDSVILINYGGHFVNVGDVVKWQPNKKKSER